MDRLNNVFSFFAMIALGLLPLTVCGMIYGTETGDIPWAIGFFCGSWPVLIIVLGLVLRNYHMNLEERQYTVNTYLLQSKADLANEVVDLQNQLTKMVTRINR